MQLKEEILLKTNGGLDIIQQIFPQADPRKKFKIRDEKEASASLKKDAHGIFWLKDFGKGTKAMNAIDLVMENYSCDFIKALKICSEELGLSTKLNENKETEFYFNKKKLIKKKFSKDELTYWGNDISEQLLNKFKIYSLKGYENLKSRSNYYLFLYGPYDGSWAKINKPHDLKNRFFQIGKKTQNFIFGLEQLPLYVNDLIIAAGEKDVINLYKQGYHAVCFSSESAMISEEQISLLKSKCENLFICYDIDEGGIKNTQKIISDYSFIKPIQLPNELKEKIDFRGNPCVDVTDFFRFFSKERFDELIDEAIGDNNFLADYKFWIEQDGEIKVELSKMYEFIKRTGIFKYKSDDVDFIKINNKIVKSVTIEDIKDFIILYIKKQNNKKLLEKIYRGRRFYFDFSSFENIHKKRELNLYKGHLNSQYFFFLGKIWEINENRIIEKKYKDYNYYLWEEHQINFYPIIDNDYFKIKKDNSNYIFQLLVSDCDFLNFIINTSNINQAKSFVDDNEFTQHILSKVTAIGYLLHTYYLGSLRKAIIATDAKERNRDQEEGGTGKSLLGQALKEIIPVFYKGSRKKNLFDEKHLLAGLTSREKIIIFDDVSPKFTLSPLYTLITGQIEIEHKFVNAFALKKEDSPKIYLTTNFTLISKGSSHDRRVFEIAFSNYYNPKFTPRDEFGYEFFGFDMPYEQWNKFYNFMAQAVKAYLKYGLIEAPKDNIRKNQLRTLISREFLEWAEEHIQPGKNVLKLSRKEFNQNFMNSISEMEKRRHSAFSIKKDLKLFCELKGYEFNLSNYGKDIKSNGVEHFEISNLRAGSKT